jgi:CheY-like chemotaxis protein
LAITKRLVEMMGGQIQARSEYGKGSVFTVLLPLVKGNPDKIINVDEIERVKATPDAKVLVVDDNADNITVAVGLLARHNIVPDIANNGQQAVEMIKTHQYDLVFMDHMMPVLDGLEATKIIRSLDGEYYRTLPIIALTANVIANAQEMFVKNGMNDFVSKPIIAGDLNHALLRWLPAEKIAAKDANPETAKLTWDAVEMNKRLHELTKIEDLSIISGLARIDGDKKLYLDILQQFYKSTEQNIVTLKKFANENLWKAYTIQIHAIKSILATIGNQFL